MGWFLDIIISIAMRPSQFPDYDIAELIETTYSGGFRYLRGVGFLRMLLLGESEAQYVLTGGGIAG